jgi:hypothetical protein
MAKAKKKISISDAVLGAALAENYGLFVERFWEVVESDTVFKPNWHITYIAGILQKEVERIARGEPKTEGDIIINIPPRSMKSYLVTMLLQPWAWATWPSLKIISTSYNAALASDHAMQSRRIIQSDLYQRLWGHVFQFRDDVDRSTWFENDKGGVRKTAGTGGGIAGKGADILICDDPINPTEVSDAAMDFAARWYEETAIPRINDQAVGVRIIVGQRVGERDLSAHEIEKARVNNKPLRHICIPSETGWPIIPKELESHYVDSLFWPQRFTRDVLEDMKIGMGSVGYANQMGQAPTPRGGMIFKKEWFRFYNPEALNLEGMTLTQTWDLSFKGDEDSALTAGQTWARRGALHYLLPGAVARKMEYTEQRRAVKAMAEMWPAAGSRLVEDAANAQAIISDLRNVVSGLIALPKRAGKIEAANACAPMAEAGQVLVPEGPEGQAFVEHLAAFPRGRYKDVTDAATLYLNWARVRSGAAASFGVVYKMRDAEPEF